MGYYITVDGNVNIYVEDLNPDCENTILFLHGWPGSRKLFEYQFDVLPAMGFRCIGIDTRGFGDSDKPFCGYDYDRLADDVREVIDALGLNNITLAGHSTGGAIAIRYMARHKGHGVSKLALFAAAAPSLVKRENFPYGVDVQTVTDIINGTYEDRPNMLRNFGDIFFFQHLTAPFSDWFFQVGLQAAGWATAKIANTWIQEVLFQDLTEICVPTLIIHGIHDKVVPFPLGEIQHQYIKNSVLMPFEFSGHGAFYDQKDEFNQALADFAK
ncbi:alpha/beta fold hydrolase [Lacrimispora xylanisolvens]|uniref:alpha/beta fold hydrolase n=1 Tax=Lacrimispora xylanisolvens TaxID=384636 RepID=UPI002402C701